MSNEVTNSTPLVTRTQHQTLVDAVEVIQHLANEAREDQKVGRAPEGVADDIDVLAAKVSGLAFLLEINDMVSDG